MGGGKARLGGQSFDGWNVKKSLLEPELVDEFLILNLTVSRVYTSDTFKTAVC